MKIRRFTITVVAILAALLAFSGSGFAAPGGGNGGGGNGGDGDTGEPPDYGDLIFLYRDANGVPIPTGPEDAIDPETGATVAGGECQQPLAFNVEDIGLCPEACVVDVVDENGDPVAVVSVNPYSCGVGAIDEDTGLTINCANCTQEVDFGRINVVRSPPSVFEAQLEDVVVNLAIADCVTLDSAGRLVANTVVEAIDPITLDPIPGTFEVLSSAIDSPIQNLAIYKQLMLTGDIGVDLLPDGANDDDLLTTAARGIGVGSGKSGEVNVDMIAIINEILGLTAADDTTILGARLSEEYREEVQGNMERVTKYFLNYRDYEYVRSSNFSDTEQSLPNPAYIPDASSYGWFEYLAFHSIDVDGTNLFFINQGPILEAVFCVDSTGAPVLPDEDGLCLGTIDLGFLTGNIGGFAQAADDTRAVINYMHNWPMPLGYATPVPCDASGDIAYDVSISDDSGLQVPVMYINGTDRELIVTVANAGPDPATGTVTVTAVETNGSVVPGSPWIYNFSELGAGFSASFPEAFMIDLGTSTTITWTAVVEAEFDVNPLNNTVTATTSVKMTGGGGGNGGQGGRPN